MKVKLLRKLRKRFSWRATPGKIFVRSSRTYEHTEVKFVSLLDHKYEIALTFETNRLAIKYMLGALDIWQVSFHDSDQDKERRKEHMEYKKRINNL